jgi:flagellar basal body-associated protein FliL
VGAASSGMLFITPLAVVIIVLITVGIAIVVLMYLKMMASRFKSLHLKRKRMMNIGQKGWAK